MEKIIKEITEFKNRLGAAQVNNEAQEIDRERFTLLLSGISACRRVPGITGHMGYEELYHCHDKKDAEQVLSHLEKMFGVSDRESLLEACHGAFSGSDEYEQFMTFWNDAPLFDINELNPGGKERFSQYKNLAEKFYPLVKEKGFYAWDINERIGLCRAAVACGIISDEEFWEITDEWVRVAQVFYNSYGEYALSCLCGAIYDMGRYESDVRGFFDINMNLLENLLGDGGAWQRNKWYVPRKREWAKSLGSNMGCFITKKASEKEYIGYMYRDEPNPEYPDSGWRFFVGDESDEYVNNADNTEVWSLNSVCNICPDVMAFLNADAGRGFARNENGWEEE